MNCKKVVKLMSNYGHNQRDGDSGRNDTPAMVDKKGVEGRHIQISKAADGAYITEVIKFIIKGIQEEDLAVDKPFMAVVVEQVVVGAILGCVDVDADTGKTSTLEMEEVDLRSNMESSDSLKEPSTLDASYKGANIDKREDFYKGVAHVSAMLAVKELTKTHSAYHQD